MDFRDQKVNFLLFNPQDGKKIRVRRSIILFGRLIIVRSEISALRLQFLDSVSMTVGLKRWLSSKEHWLLCGGPGFDPQHL